MMPIIAIVIIVVTLKSGTSGVPGLVLLDAVACSSHAHNQHNISALEVFSRNALYKFTFYITLHYMAQIQDIAGNSGQGQPYLHC